MRKIVVFLAIGMSIILLLGFTGSGLKSQEAECEHKPTQLRQNVSEYTIVSASKLDKLQKDVNKKLKNDWYPIGGISIVDSNSFCQVMVKP